MYEKPYAESCEQNKQPILQVLKEVFAEPGTVFEIGSGTGQHAVYFTEQMPHLYWQPSDLADQIPGMCMWIREAGHDRIHAPHELDVSAAEWPVVLADYVFTANTAHIVSWARVVDMFAGVGRTLKQGGFFAQYGPFNYGGRFTSESNERFDQWLKQRDSKSGVRNFEDLVELAEKHGLQLFRDYEMPANNRILVWNKL
jgi:hypothetical protein